jgi:hypothetical protein
MNDSEEGEGKTPTAHSPQPPLLKTLENMLHSRIAKDIEMHKSRNRADTDEVWNETLQWVLAQILSATTITITRSIIN